MRSDFYSLLGGLLFFAPSQQVIDQVKGLSGDETEIGRAFSTLANLAEKSTLQAVKAEFNDLIFVIIC